MSGGRTLVSDVKDETEITSFITNGDQLEDANVYTTEQEGYAKNARNILRHITRGTPFGLDGASFADSKLVTDENKATLFKQRDPRLLAALRRELQNILNAIFMQIKSLQCSAKKEKQLEILITHLLAAYPFLDPVEFDQPQLGVDNSTLDFGEPNLIVPQKIAQKWEQVKYTIEAIDVSPKTGLLSLLIEDEDRMYMYGLVPDQKGASIGAASQLLLMGTTYPAGQGEALAVIYNFTPGLSVGEGHDMTDVNTWIQKQKKVKVSGHSKGAAMAMLLAAEHADKISEAHCLNPPGLCKATLKRLRLDWDERIRRNRLMPKINVYTQAGDPIFSVDDGFLPGTVIQRITPNNSTCSMNFKWAPTWLMKLYEAHIHHFAGRTDVSIDPLDTQLENNRSKREFLGDLKSMLNYCFFYIKYSKFVLDLCARKIQRFCKKHKTVLKGLLFVMLLGVSVVLAMTGMCAPLLLLLKPYIVKLGISMTANIAMGLTTAACVIVSAMGTYLAPALTKLTIKIADAVTLTGLHVASLLLIATAGSLCSGIKIGLKALGHKICAAFSSPPPVVAPPVAAVTVVPTALPSSTAIIRQQVPVTQSSAGLVDVTAQTQILRAPQRSLSLSNLDRLVSQQNDGQSLSGCRQPAAQNILGL